MVVEDNDLYATRGKIDNLRSRRSSAVEGNEKLRMKLFEAPLNTFAAQAVAFLHPQRQKQVRRCAESAEGFGQQRERSHAIDIVIAKEHDSLPAI